MSVQSRTATPPTATSNFSYRNVPKFSDRQVLANSAEEKSDLGLHCLHFPLHLLDAFFWMHYSKEKPSCSTFRVITANFQMSEILGFLR